MTLVVDSNIYFFYEDIDFNLEDESQYIYWIKSMIIKHKAVLDSLNYIFCSDEYLLQINKEFLSHEYYTDIISFPYREFPDAIQGDIFISIERVNENSVINGVPVEDELLRVMAHGLLHFLGYKDKSESESAIMRQKEENMMLLFK